MDNQEFKMKKPIYKRKWFLITISILVILILLPKNNDKKNQLDEKVTENNGNVISKSGEKNERDISTTVKNNGVEEKISSTIFSIEQANDSYFSNFKDKRVFEVVKKFEGWGEVLIRFDTLQDIEIQKECKKLRSMVIDKQTKYFPKLRVTYSEYLPKTLHSQSLGRLKSTVDVLCLGPDMDTLVLNNTKYRDVNVTKKEYDNIVNDVISLRFKKIIFRNNITNSETIYTLDTPPDSDLYQ